VRHQHPFSGVPFARYVNLIPILSGPNGRSLVTFGAGFNAYSSGTPALRRPAKNVISASEFIEAAP
jgi:hypothetical protein